MARISALRLARLTAGYTQPQLAALVGMTQQFLSRLERGRAMPRLDRARAIAVVLDTSVDAIFPLATAQTDQTRREALHDAPAA